MASVAAGVATALSTYLFPHPDVNGFYTGLQDQPKDQIQGAVEDYFNAHPQEQADLKGIRQPMTDIGGDPVDTVARPGRPGTLGDYSSVAVRREHG